MIVPGLGGRPTSHSCGDLVLSPSRGGREQACAEDKFGDPSYRTWHRHLSLLFAEARPGLSADFLAHAVLAVFDGELIRQLTPPGDPRRFTRSILQLAAALLGS